MEPTVRVHMQHRRDDIGRDGFDAVAEIADHIHDRHVIGEIFQHMMLQRMDLLALGDVVEHRDQMLDLAGFVAACVDRA